MGMISSAASQGELKDLLRWVEKHKNYDSRDNAIIDYDELVKEIKERIEAADYE